MRSASRERFDRTFHGATREFLKGTLKWGLEKKNPKMQEKSSFYVYDFFFLSLQHRRKSQKSGFWNTSSALAGKEFHKRDRDDTHDFAPDPLLSPFVCGLPFLEPKETSQQDKSSAADPSIGLDLTRCVSFQHSEMKFVCLGI